MDCAVAGSNCAPGETLSHRLKDSARQGLIQPFANAPVPNPVGPDGISLHLLVDQAIPRQQFLSLGCRGASSVAFDAIKADAAFFGSSNPRRFAFHYAIFAHRQSSTSTASGCAELPGNDLIITLGEWNTACIQPGPNGAIDAAVASTDLRLTSPQGRTDVIATGPDLVCDSVAARDDIQVVPVGGSPPADLDGDGLDNRRVGTAQQQAVALMHELGHNFGLEHGGDEEKNYKPNYLSVMNYLFFNGLRPQDPDGAGALTARVDYSKYDLAPLDELQLNEGAGIASLGHPNIDSTLFFCLSGRSSQPVAAADRIAGRGRGG